MRHGHECLAHQIRRTDGLERSETVFTGQHDDQGFLNEMMERQLRKPLFSSKEGRINGSLDKGIRKRRRVLTRYRYVDVRQFIAQDSKNFRHPRQFVVGQKAYDEAWLRWMSDPAGNVGGRFNLR